MHIEKKFLNSRKVLVVGDLMLDQYVNTEMIKISAEAPVPVVKRKFTDYRLGGAANVAGNVSALGASTDIIGLVGEDFEGDTLISLLQTSGVGTELLSKSRNLETISKTRILVDKHQLLRIDREQKLQNEDDSVFSTFEKVVGNYDVVVLSDYGKGALNDIQKFINLANNCNVKVLIDPKGQDYKIYEGAFILTPNFSEFEAIAGKCINLQAVIDRAIDLRISLKIENLIVTLGSDGMLLVNELECIHIETDAQEVFDVSGAGDTVIAALAVFIGGAFSLFEACSLANTAAGIVVSKWGTALVTFDELKNRIDARTLKDQCLLSLPQAEQLIQRAKLNKQTIVMTNGCFDILHAGHISYLKKAKSLGDILIVAINSDESVRRIKGKSRPINNLQSRALVVEGLESVNAVVSFSEDTPLELYKLLLPDVLVKGGDYQIEDVIGGKEVSDNGGFVKIIPFLEGYSTTKLINKIKD